MMVEALLVDVGGTLWPDKWPTSIEDLYRRNLMRVLPDATTEAIGLLMHELQERDPGATGEVVVTQDTGRAVTAALSAAGLPGAKVEAVLHAMDLPAKGIVEPFEHAEILLETARHLGLRCVVISNATYRTGRAYRRDFDSFSLGSLIDGIVSSVDIGYRKPHELLFLAAAAEAEAAPNNCVLIGDSEEKDILPARGLGMTTIQVAVEGPVPSDSPADLLVTSLHEAAAALPELINDRRDA